MTQRRGQDQGRHQNRPEVINVDPERYGLPVGPQSDVDLISAALLKAREKCNVLAPAMRLEYLPPDHMLSMLVVQFPLDGIEIKQWQGEESAAKFQANGVWYSLDGGKVTLTKTALDQIAQAAGITWVFEKCGRTDDRKTSLRWAYRMTCQLKGLDGRTREVSREHELDLREKSPAAIKAAGKGGAGGTGLRNARINGAQLCESKAANRAIRAALGIHSYSIEDARKPFVFPVLRWVPPANPMIQAMIAAKELGLTEQLFGSLAFGAAPEAERVIDQEPRRPALPAPQDEPDPEEQERRNAQREPVRQERPRDGGQHRQRGRRDEPWGNGPPDDGRHGGGR